jgi:hypothetical protein
VSYLTDHAGNPIANQQGGALETQAGGYATAYVSQIGATDLSAGSPTARASALGGSVLASGTPTARASALGSLALIGGTPNARTSTLGFQVLSAVASVAKLTGVTVVPASATIDLGDNFSFFAEGSFADGTSRVLHESEIAWSADEGTEITAAGNAHPTQLGTSTITATPANNITNPPSVPTSNP